MTLSTISLKKIYCKNRSFDIQKKKKKKKKKIKNKFLIIT
jgi:hypothetical protein